MDDISSAFLIAFMNENSRFSGIMNLQDKIVCYKSQK